MINRLGILFFLLAVLASSRQLHAQESAPTLIVEAPTASSVTLRWDSIEVRDYQLERSRSLNDWLPLGDRLQGTGVPMEFEDPIADRAFYRLKVLPPLPSIRKIAVTGDSVTTQGNYNLSYLSALGYYGWARAFCGSKWELVKNGDTYHFGVSGTRSDQLRALCWDAIMASDADVCVLTYGVHDVNQGVPPQTFIAGAISDWAAFRKAGIQPVAVTLLPMSPAYFYNHARIAEYNAALRIAAQQHNVPLCDWTHVMEAEPGSNNGEGDPTLYFRNDGIHPNPYAASMLGRELAKTLKKNFRAVAPLWTGERWLTPNIQLNGSDGQPTGGWNVTVPAGGAVTSKTIIATPEGNWWELEFSPGTSTGNFMAANHSGNLGGPPAGLTVECTAEIQVMSGSLDNVSLYGSGSALFAIDMHGVARIGRQIVAEDGIVVLRTLPITLPSSTTWATASLYFNSTEPSRIRVRNVGVHEIE
jgi:lysophospholipase L1-like esterase